MMTMKSLRWKTVAGGWDLNLLWLHEKCFYLLYRLHYAKKKEKFYIGTLENAFVYHTIIPLLSQNLIILKPNKRNFLHYFFRILNVFPLKDEFEMRRIFIIFIDLSWIKNLRMKDFNMNEWNFLINSQEIPL